MLRMLGSRALVARLAPRHQATRHKGILSSFKESIDKEMKKNPELQKTLDELREGAVPLAKGAQEAASKLSSAAAEGASQAAERAGKAADAAAKAADAATKAGEAAKARATEAAAAASQSEMAQKAEQMAAQARQAMDEARAKASEAAGGAAGEKEAGAGGEAGSGAGAGAGGEAPPLYARLMEDVENLFKSAKERLFAGTGVAVGRAPGPDDTESRGVVVKEPSFWEKATNQAGQSAFMRGFAGFAGAAGEGVSGVADRVMGENEQAEAVALLREQMPHFDQEAFLEHVKTTMAPEVLGAYLKGEVAPVKLHCREQARAPNPNPKPNPNPMCNACAHLLPLQIFGSAPKGLSG